MSKNDTTMAYPLDPEIHDVLDKVVKYHASSEEFARYPKCSIHHVIDLTSGIPVTDCLKTELCKRCFPKESSFYEQTTT